jgi:hypothetical protein
MIGNEFSLQLCNVFHTGQVSEECQEVSTASHSVTCYSNASGQMQKYNLRYIYFPTNSLTSRRRVFLRS